MPHPVLARDILLPDTELVDRRLVSAHRELLEALEDAREKGCAYFSAPLGESVLHRDAYYDALARQSAAESAFFEAKHAFGRARFSLA